MRSLIPLSLYCISLCCLQIQALPTGNRLDFMTRLHQLMEKSSVSPQPELTVRVEGIKDRPFTDPVALLDKTSLWRALLIRNQPPTFEKTTRVFRVPQNTLFVGGASDEHRNNPTRGRSRSRRHAHYRGHHHQHHGQLMRVGCILGTCQVQNLSHRLYQLVGQTGREDSPINPHSPHSYG